MERRWRGGQAPEGVDGLVPIHIHSEIEEQTIEHSVPRSASGKQANSGSADKSRAYER